MTTEDFFVLTVTDFPTEDLEILTELAFRFGAEGTEETLPFIQKNLEYEVITTNPTETTIKVYFLKAPESLFLQELQVRWPAVQTHLSSDKYRDWIAEWKKQFKPFCLTDGVWVVPSWLPAPIEAQQVIQIDPGMAFGTGTHATTQLAADLIAQYGHGVWGSMLDVGTGTGILAILADRLGFKNIVGNDIDTEALRVARENVELNKALRVQVVDDQIENIQGHFDWVVANIIDGVLIRLQRPLKERVARGGMLLLTGILSEREEYFREHFQFAGFEIVERKQRQEWVGFLLRQHTD